MINREGEVMRVAIWNDEAEELGEIGVDDDGNPIVEMAGAWEEVKTRSDIERVLDWVLDTPEGLRLLGE